MTNNKPSGKRAMESLRESEEKFRDVFEAANVGKSITRPTGEVSANKAFADMLGYSQEELENRNWQELTPPEDIPPNQAMLDPLLKGVKDAVRFNKRYLHKNGSTVWADVSTTLSRGEDGKPKYYITTVVDITVRRRAEAALRESEERYRSLFEHMSEGMAYCRMLFENGRPTDFIYLDVNEAFTTQTGLKKVVGRKVAEIIPGIREADPELFERYGRVALTGQPERFETYVVALKMWFSISVYSPAKEHFVAVFDVITARKQSEEELSNELTRRRVLIEQSRDGIVILDQDGNVLESNKKFAEMLGYPIESMCKLNVSDWEFLHPRERVIEMIRSVDEKGDHFVTRHRRRDGSIYDAEISTNAAWFGEQKLIFCVCRDITERVRAQEALRQSEAFILAVMDNLPVGVAVNSLEPYVVFEYMNDNFPAFYRTTRQALSIPDNFWDAVYEDPTFREEMRKRVLGGIASGEPERMCWENVPISRTGEKTRYISARNVQVPGKPLMISTVWDVTERTLAEEDKQKFFLLAESSSEFIGMCDLDFNPLYVNPAGIRMVGLPDLAAACQVKVQDYFFPVDQKFITDEFFPRVLRDGNGDVEIRLRHFQTDEEIWMLYYLFAVRDASGTTVGWATVSRDITERKQIYEEKALLEEQLQQAQKLESVGRLAGGVAHDFNNILNVIIGYGDIILEQLHREDPLREDMKTILDAGHRAAALTRQLLAFSRKQTLQPEMLDLNALIRNLDKMLRRLIGEDILLELSLADDIFHVLADPGQIEQVIMNLAVNARDAMPTGGSLIVETANVALDETYAREHEGTEPGEYAMLAVTDAGCGMNKEILGRIFEPFFTTKEKERGTGLGLATVYGIVKQSGGNIWVYSEPGKGTTFKVYLPKTGISQQPQATKLEHVSLGGGGEHILVVEDEESLRKMAETILSRAGYTVTLAANGGEALLLIEEKGLKPDLVITDVVMPKMSGKVLIERLKRNRPHLKALYMSGYTDNAIVHHGVLDSAVHFLQKPFTRKAVLSKVRQVLEEKREPVA